MKYLTLVLIGFLPTLFCQVVLPLTKITLPPTISERSVSGTIKLGGNISSYGEFYATVNIGTPAVSFFVQADTGSSDLLVYANDCINCNTGVSTYNPSSSSSSAIVACGSPQFSCTVDVCTEVGSQSACGFHDTYGSGASVIGYVAVDKFSIGPVSGFNATFGGIRNSTGNFENVGISGIWGLAYKNLSFWEGDTIFDNMVKTSSMFNGFSMCLTDNYPSMTLGVDYSANTQFQWTPILLELFYVVGLNTTFLGSTSLGTKVTAIVDSGTTLLVVPTPMFDTIQSTLTAMCSSSVDLPGVCNLANPAQTLFDGYCFNMNQQQINNFPQFTFTLFNITSPFSVSILRPVLINGLNYQCLGVGSGGGGLNLVILGDVVMKYNQVAFDRQHKQVGFGPLTSCPGYIPPTTGSSATGASTTGKSDASITKFSLFLLGTLLIALL